MSQPVLSAVVPVLNEAGNIDRLLAELAHALAPLKDFEIVYVNDGSTDGTANALAVARARLPQLRVLSHRETRGQSAAIMSGVRAARAEWIVTLDGDGQNDPADIALLLRTCEAELKRLGDPDAALMICGRRANRRDSLSKRLSSRMAASARAALLGDRTPDTGCSLKLFRRRDFLALPQFDHMHRFLTALARRADGRVVSVDVNHRPRASGKSNYGVFDRLWVGIVDLFGVMWLMRRAPKTELGKESGTERS